MGQYAEDIIDNCCDSFGDYTYKSNYGPRGNKHPNGKYRKTAFIHLTPVEKNIAAVRKELAILIKAKIKANPTANQNILVEQARSEINLKYGKGWRERGLVVNSDNQWKPLNQYPL